MESWMSILGYDKHDPVGCGSGDSRVGTRLKTVVTDNVGVVKFRVPLGL